MEQVNYHEALLRAAELSQFCPPAKAFSVGAILFDAEGHEVATGYSRETDPVSHAEEVAIAKAKDDGVDIRGGTIVCSLEPCGARLSRPVSCADLIIKEGIARVVYATAEPPTFFTEPCGASKLKAAGVETLVYPI